MPGESLSLSTKIDSVLEKIQSLHYVKQNEKYPYALKHILFTFLQDPFSSTTIRVPPVLQVHFPVAHKDY